MPPVNTIFKPLNAMKLRTSFGTLLDKVEFQNQRFAIHRRGKIKALLVPVGDAEKINDQVSTEKLDQTYKALDRIKGSVTDPSLYDASNTIDEYLYGELTKGEDE